MITFACVRAGKKYPAEYVNRLRSMITRHCQSAHRVICLTDQPESYEGVERIDIGQYRLNSWWPKLLLFLPNIRGPHRTIYLDLDTVIVGDLSPLAEWNGQFGICENFARLAGAKQWPCRYGSCVMSFAPGWGQYVWDGFAKDRDMLMREAGNYGDQWVIERMVPFAHLLQSELPKGFFLNKRDLPNYPESPPPDASIVVFGGNQRPHNCETEWARAAWN